MFTKRSDAKTDRMRDLHLFRSCSDGELSRVARLFDEVNVEAGATIIREGDRGLQFFVIESGEANVTLRGDHLATLDAGRFFGEMAVLEPAPRAATVTAATDMRLLVAPAQALAQLFEESPPIAVKMLRSLAERLRVTENAPLRFE